MMLKGRQKKLQNLAERRSSALGSTKPSLLHEQSSKIQQKLNQLKEQIIEKRKLSVNDKKDSGSTSSELKQFISRIGMGEYLPCLQQNAIDSLQILREVRQSELEEIGVAKGHALKIVVTLKKEEERKKKSNLADQKSKTQIPPEPALSRIKVERKPVKGTSEIFESQTESIPLELTKKQFCLYCFTRSDYSFCAKNCESLYNAMFQRYENNLQQAEANFLGQPEEEEQQRGQKVGGQRQQSDELSDNQEFLQNFDFLFQLEKEELDVDEYSKVKGLLQK